MIDDLRQENRQYLKYAKKHAGETSSHTQVDPWTYLFCSFFHAPLRTCEKCNQTTLLQDYGFLEHFIQLVRIYYHHLPVLAAMPGILSTSAIHFALTIFPGCTLSPTLFNNIEQKLCGYQFSSDPDTILQSLAYADDIQLMTSLVVQNQRLLNIFHYFSVVVTNHVSLSKQISVCGGWRNVQGFFILTDRSSVASYIFPLGVCVPWQPIF